VGFPMQGPLRVDSYREHEGDSAKGDHTWGIRKCFPQAVSPKGVLHVVSINGVT
jgi:hypothetical protein